MSVTWYLLGKDSRETLELGNGLPEWWTDADADALQFHSFGEVNFNTRSLSVESYMKCRGHSLGGRLPASWQLLLVARFRAANTNGLQLVNVNDIWQGPDDASPLALPGEDPTDPYFLPVVGSLNTDPDCALLYKYLPELRDPHTVQQIVDEMKARGAQEA